jgi:hypothetical protein
MKFYFVDGKTIVEIFIFDDRLKLFLFFYCLTVIWYLLILI